MFDLPTILKPNATEHDRALEQAINKGKSYFLRDGAPRKIEFSLTLKSYGPDAGGLASFIGGLL